MFKILKYITTRKILLSYFLLAWDSATNDKDFNIPRDEITCSQVACYLQCKIWGIGYSWNKKE